MNFTYIIFQQAKERRKVISCVAALTLTTEGNKKAQDIFFDQGTLSSCRVASYAAATDLLSHAYYAHVCTVVLRSTHALYCRASLIWKKVRPMQDHNNIIIMISQVTLYCLQ